VVTRLRYYADKAAFIARLALCAAGAPTLADRLADAVEAAVTASRPWSVTPTWARLLPAQCRADLQSYRFERLRPGARTRPRRWTLSMLATSLAYCAIRPLVIGRIPTWEDEYNCSHCSRPTLRWQHTTCSPRCARDQAVFFEEQQREQLAEVRS
jgi:hypothetical protein